MDKEQKEILYRPLCRVQKQVPHVRTGICNACMSEIYKLDEFSFHKDYSHYRLEMRRLFPSWSHYSGDPEHPISSNPTLTPGQEYISSSYGDRYWFGEYGRLRKDLLNHMIKTLEEELK